MEDAPLKAAASRRLRVVTMIEAVDPLSEEFRDAVSRAIAEFLDGRTSALDGLGADLAPVLDMARAFTSGGKRLRPAFCCWGYAAAAGSTEIPDSVIAAAASLDLLHVAALMHDDVMDASDTRRGMPAAHVQFAQLHAGEHRRGSAAAYGQAGAILLGDLLLVWSAQMLAESGAPRLAAAAPLAAAVREEVNAGQVLDTAAQTRSPLETRTDLAAALARIEQVVEYKTARYTVIRPLQIGAALGGGSPELLRTLATFGSPLGRAFQYRDDLLGVFGDEAVTGKPAGDDLREGKLTVLVARAMAGLDPTSAQELDALLGRPLTPAQITQAQTLIVDSGAVDAVENDIAQSAAQARAVLTQHIDYPPARQGLDALVGITCDRNT